MTGETPPLGIARILVALDDSTESRIALEAAARIARRLRAELMGVFIEDIGILELAEHPVVRHLSLTTRAPVRPERRAMERGIRAQAEAARRDLAHAAESRQVEWSFRIARGRVDVELLAAAPEADLVVLGKTSLSGVGKGRLGRTARALAASNQGAILFSEHRRSASAHEGPVMVVYDGTGPARRALIIAARITNRDGGTLAVLVPGESAEEAETLQREAADSLRGERIAVEFDLCSGRGCDSLLRAVARRPGSLLVIGEESVLLGDEPVTELIARSESPVLLVRGSRPAA